MLSPNGPDFWFPGGAGHWQKCQIVRDVPSLTYQILAKIAWFINFLSSILLPRNRKKGRCCHKMAHPDFWFPGGAAHWQKCQIVTDVPSLTYQIFSKMGSLIFYLVFSFPGTGKRVDAVTGGAGHWQKCQIVRDVPSSTYQIFAKIAWFINFLSSILLPRNRKKGKCCHQMTQISGFQVVLGIDKNVRLSEMFLLWHTKFWPKLHGSLIFYLVFSFPGTGKRVDAVTKWAGFLFSRWHWALTKMSDCRRCSFFDIPNFGQISMVH